MEMEESVGRQWRRQQGEEEVRRQAQATNRGERESEERRDESTTEQTPNQGE